MQKILSFAGIVTLPVSIMAFPFSFMDQSDSEAPPRQFTRGSCFDGGSQEDMRLWVDAEYLLWWSKGTPLDAPLATTGSVDDTVPAALGQPGTRTLLGKGSMDVKMQSGFRAALRTWFGDDNKYAVEGTGFYLPKITDHNFSKSSDPGTGLPVLGVPFFNDATLPLPVSTAGGWVSIDNSGETALLASDGTTYSGTISVKTSSELWDVELNGLFNFSSWQDWSWSALVGVIYADLTEGLDLYYTTQQIASPDAVFRETSITDHFSTHNQFYGGQLGVRGEWSKKWWFANFLAKLAIGDMVERVDIGGSFIDPNPFVYTHYGVGQGGIFAQPTNMGKHTVNHLAFIPQITLRVGANLLRDFRLSVGYDFFLMSRVVRPGNQIDRSINETQAGPGPSGAAAALTGDAVPAKRAHTSVFWAQGINAGIEFRF